jgi:hypothetical protein
MVRYSPLLACLTLKGGLTDAVFVDNPRIAKEDCTMPRLRKLAKDPDSGTNGCPSVYAIDTMPDYLVIQSDQADDEIMANLENPLPRETAVVIKREVVVAALRKLLAEGGTS